MRNRDVIEKRFLEDPLPIRLGNLASNLSRISFFSQAGEKNRKIIEDVLEESKFFIEWAAPETDMELAGWLVEIQMNLTFWQDGWRKHMKEPQQLRRISALTEAWSSELLKRAGLL